MPSSEVVNAAPASGIMTVHSLTGDSKRTLLQQMNRSLHAVREQDARTIALFALGRLLTSVGRSALRYGQRPALSDFDELGEATTDPATMARLLGCSSADFHQYLGEFAECEAARVRGSSAAVAARYPALFASELNTQRVLYALVRAQRPDVVLETGVADGFSSFAILAALDANSNGHLHSVDIQDDVGIVVPAALRGRWTVHINDREMDLERGLKDIVAGLPPVDFYYHDSGHTYLWQSFEYGAVAELIRTGGTFMSDDVDWSYAFIDHCKARRVTPGIMVEGRKVVGGYSA